MPGTTCCVYLLTHQKGLHTDDTTKMRNIPLKYFHLLYYIYNFFGLTGYLPQIDLYHIASYDKGLANYYFCEHHTYMLSEMCKFSYTSSYVHNKCAEVLSNYTVKFYWQN